MEARSQPSSTFDMSQVVWAPLESNPATINTYLSKIGVKGTECVDVFSFDDDVLQFIPKRQLAMILCFPEYKKVDEIMNPIYENLKKEGKTEFPDVFFMKQKISNACGTFALFHALANLEGLVDLGTGCFADWLKQAKGASVDERSDLLAKNEALATAHAETAQQGESSQPESVEHHFICYVNKNGNLYELDSRAPFPRLIGTTTPESLVKDAGAACKHLMDKLSNTSFAAMALVNN
ncbi:unnamed protein product [Auanema sp. JU1783]|nr:unnamed protein product [Auanema sp. JU1783]